MERVQTLFGSRQENDPWTLEYQAPSANHGPRNWKRLVGPDAANLVRNNVAFSEVMVFQRVISLTQESCKEHRSGSSDALRV
jgi:hypothetical protein